MNENAFDRRMRQLAARDPETPDTTRLERVLASLPPRQEARVSRTVVRRLVPVLAAMLLVCATALAAQYGLNHFMERNPYAFYHQDIQNATTLNAQPLTILDSSNLARLSVTPIDSAWIEGRLTMTLRVSTADSLPLYAADLSRAESGMVAALYDREDQPPQIRKMPCEALLLLYENAALYTRPNGTDALQCAPQLTWETQEDGILLALQCPADFILASEVDGLTDADGRIPLRLELHLCDGTTGEMHAESLLLSAAAPTESEKEEMDP